MRTKALILRIFRQVIRDKRTLVLIFIAPLLLLTLMYFLFKSDSIEPKIGLININTNLEQALESNNIVTSKLDDANKKTAIDQKLDGFLDFENGNYTLTLTNSDPNISKIVQSKVTQILVMKSKSEQANTISTPEIKTDYIYGNANSSFFDTLFPVLICFFVFFFVFLISGIGLLGEKVTGTLERLLSTPIKRSEIIAGYLSGYGVLALLQTLLIIIYSVIVLGLAVTGSMWLVIIINILIALVALSLGLLLSSFAASEFQMMQFIPIIIVPQIFFVGIFPVDGMAPWLQAIAKVMPIYYAAEAQRGVVYKGWGFGEIKYDLLILILYVILFIILNIFALKRYRKL